MTNKEAKMQIQAIPEKIWDQLSEPDKEAMEMAFSALEKQIPQKLIIVEHGLVKCAECGKYIRFPLNNNCPECGQAIDWEGERW